MSELRAPSELPVKLFSLNLDNIAFSVWLTSSLVFFGGEESFKIRFLTKLATVTVSLSFLLINCRCVRAKTKNTCACLHLCEGEARVLRWGEADASMVAHRLLVQGAKGHQTGISYIVRKRYLRFHVLGRRFHFPCPELKSDECA